MPQTISHDLLIAKIEAYGFHRNALTLVYSLLTNRMHEVKVVLTYSSTRQISIGIPQDSVLGPLLLNIFINHLFLLEMESEICTFADNTTIYAFDTSIQAVMIRLKSDLNTIFQ